MRSESDCSLVSIFPLELYDSDFVAFLVLINNTFDLSFGKIRSTENYFLAFLVEYKKHFINRQSRSFVKFDRINGYGISFLDYILVSFEFYDSIHDN